MGCRPVDGRRSAGAPERPLTSAAASALITQLGNRTGHSHGHASPTTSSLSARRRWVVILAWVIILGGVATAYAAADGPLTSTLSIPGTPAQKVNDQLAQSFTSASGSTGQIVFSTHDGKQFTPRLQSSVASALTRASKIDGVSNTVKSVIWSTATPAAVSSGPWILVAQKVVGYQSPSWPGSSILRFLAACEETGRRLV